jgi:hypothetical protein
VHASIMDRRPSGRHSGRSRQQFVYVIIICMATIGVTGHRILADLEKIYAAIDQALSRIQQRFPNQSLRLLTQLSDGADRLVAEHFLKRPGWRIAAVLPMPLQKYLDDFSVDSRKTFLELLQHCEDVIQMQNTENRDSGYEAAGEYIIEHSEALIAIWDGQPEQGQGGTGAVVNLARRKKLPLAWIHAGNREPGTLKPTTLNAEQGTITFERF